MLTGDRIDAVERRGKYIVVHLESGHVLLVHLRMTGGFRYAPSTHERAVLELEDGSRVAYRDTRRFGTWQLEEEEDAEQVLALKNGPEPLGRGFTAAFLGGRLARRTAPLKAAILDQRTVAGLGNIYADEGLWHARLDPRRPAGSLTTRRSLRCATASARRCAAALRAVGRRCTTRHTRAVRCRTSFGPTPAWASLASGAARRSRRRSSAVAARRTARTARS